MKPMGFVLFFIGIALIVFAKRIVLGKIKMDSADEKELELLAQGGVIAVRVAGLVVAALGLIFLML